MKGSWWKSIRENGMQIKDSSATYIQAISIPLILIFVGLSAFGLGRHSAQEPQRPAVTTQTAGFIEQQPLTIGGKYVASKRGSKYHFPWCPGAQAMSEQNKIWFDSVDEARGAGYTPAGNCKGLR